MRVVEIETQADFDRRAARGTRAAGWHLQSVDLTERSAALADLDVAGAVFLGCRFAPGDEHAVRARGGLVFPALPEVPFDPYRSQLYRPEELYAGLDHGYESTPDARIYSWDKGDRAVDRTLASALHDHAIDDALEEWGSGRRVVGVMGGHGVDRGTDDYLDAVRLGHALAEHAIVATGGGPGAMEAANLGAFLPSGSDLGAVVARLSATPTYSPDIGAWATSAFEVAREVEGRANLGVPTWFYGHEPPNVFATAIAKYFRNAIREDVLLRICRAGIVFLPGAAGTVQEIFQSACENYYAAATDVAPMVLVGVRQWTRDSPAWPLLQAQAAQSPMVVHLVDSVEEAAALLSRPRAD